MDAFLNLKFQNLPTRQLLASQSQCSCLKYKVKDRDYDSKENFLSTRLQKKSKSGHQFSYSQFVYSVSKFRTPNHYPRQYAAIFCEKLFLSNEKSFPQTLKVPY